MLVLQKFFSSRFCTLTLKTDNTSHFRRIYGFVSKSKAKELLRPHKPGTFLLRISESKISETGPNITGALSPVVVSTKKKNGEFLNSLFCYFIDLTIFFLFYLHHVQYSNHQTVGK